MPPVWNQRVPLLEPKIGFPVEVAGLDLADGGVAAIVAAGCGANAESALGEVEAVANGAAYAVEGDPFEERSVDAALKDAVFDEAANGVVGERGGDGGAEAEAAAETAGDVVLAAALPNREVTRGVNASLARVEAEHDFAETETIPAPVRIGKQNRFHIRSNETVTHCGGRRVAMYRWWRHGVGAVRNVKEGA